MFVLSPASRALGFIVARSLGLTPQALCYRPLRGLLVFEKRQGNVNSMKKQSAKRNNDELRPEYDLSRLKGGVRGKYYREASAGTNLVLIEPELADVFPDTESVNRALRLLADTAESATDAPGSSPTVREGSGTKRAAVKKRIKRTA